MQAERCPQRQSQHESRHTENERYDIEPGASDNREKMPACWLFCSRELSCYFSLSTAADRAHCDEKDIDWYLWV